MPKTTSIFNSLRFRLITSVVTIEIIMLSILVWNNVLIIHTTHTDRLRDTAASMLQQIANTSGNYMMAVDYATLEDYLRNIINYKELAYITVLDRDNNTVITLGSSSFTQLPKTDVHPAQVHDGIYDVAKDINVADLPMGRLQMGFSLSLMENAIHESRKRGITIAAIEIILTVIVTVLIGLGLTRRLSVLANAAAEVEVGDYTVTVPIETNDEVGKTAHAFNKMVAEISSRSHQLEQQEKVTKKLLRENRLLIKKSLEVQEEERKNLARELHDELGQCITAIQADAKSIRDLSPKNDKRTNISADAILSVSAHIYDVVHSMMHLLRPSVLDNLGLIEALKEEIHAWNKRNPKTSCIHHFDGDLSNLGEGTNITIYRIVQEGLTNIAKHANATHVDITLINDKEKIHLTINDDGVGMNSHTVDTGLGLIGIRERIQALGGVFFYETSPENGFNISIHIPLTNNE